MKRLVAFLLALPVAALTAGSLLLAACGGEEEEAAVLTTATPAATSEVATPTQAATEEEIEQILEPLLDPEWAKLRSQIDLSSLSSPTPPQLLWTYRISPPFPSAWPPEPGVILYYYAYAAGFDPDRGLGDAEVVAAPWARAEVDPTGGTSPKVLILAPQIKAIGIQGFSPATEEQIAVYGMKDAVTDYLVTLDVQSPETEHARQVKVYFCQWTDLNGLIAAEIRPLHEDFFRWLACGGDESDMPLAERSPTATAQEPTAAPTPPEYIGVATMLEDGTIVLVLSQADGAFVDHELRYPPSDPQYADILDHLGGLQPGETKPVPPWPEETVEPSPGATAEAPTAAPEEGG